MTQHVTSHDLTGDALTHTRRQTADRQTGRHRQREWWSVERQCSSRQGRCTRRDLIDSVNLRVWYRCFCCQSVEGAHHVIGQSMQRGLSTSTNTVTTHTHTHTHTHTQLAEDTAATHRVSQIQPTPRPHQHSHWRVKYFPKSYKNIIVFGMINMNYMCQ